MDNQEDPPVQENPPEAPLAQLIVPPTQMMMYSQLPMPPPMSLKGILAENRTFSERVGRVIRYRLNLIRNPNQSFWKLLR